MRPPAGPGGRGGPLPPQGRASPPPVAAPARLQVVPPRGPARVDPAATAAVEAAVRLAERHLSLPPGRRGPFPGVDAHSVRARWAELARGGDPRPLGARADALRAAADEVRRQHLDTAEDLGPLWDTWAGPDAEAVQRRMSSLARSAQALVGELSATADQLDDAAGAIVATVHDLARRADRLRQRFDEPGLRDFVDALDAAREANAAAWSRAARPPPE